MNTQKIGIHVLRFGLATLFLWFGFSQLLDGVSWVAWVPMWAVNLIHLPPAMIVLLNGLVEVVGGALLATGILVRPTALVLGAHLALITFDIGLTPIGVRDFALTTATLALVLLQNKSVNTGSIS